MTPVNRTQPELIDEALEHLRVIPTYAAQGLESQLVLDAIAMRLTAGIEALRALDNETRERLFGTKWRAMWATRNRLAHSYAIANPDIIRATIKESLPELISTLEEEQRRSV